MGRRRRGALAVLIGGAGLAGCVGDFPAPRGQGAEAGLGADGGQTSDLGAIAEDSGRVPAADGAPEGPEAGRGDARPPDGGIEDRGLLPEPDAQILHFDAEVLPSDGEAPHLDATPPEDGGRGPDAAPDADLEPRTDAEPTDAEPDADVPLPWDPDPTAPLVWREIHAGDNLTCGLRSDGRAHCWGDLGRNGERQAPADRRYVTISVWKHRGCGVRHPGGEIECWSRPLAAVSFLDGGFSAVSAGERLVCGLRDQAVVCAGEPAALPGGDDFGPGAAWTAVAVGVEGGCVLDRQGGLSCFGLQDLRAVPPGRYSEVAVGEAHACAVQVEDGAGQMPANPVVCWGETDNPALASPAGIWTRLASAPKRTCALSAEGAAACWGTGGAQRTGVWAAPALSRVSVSASHNCGLTPEGQGHCWGQPGDFPAAVVPAPGSF